MREGVLDGLAHRGRRREDRKRAPGCPRRRGRPPNFFSCTASAGAPPWAVRFQRLSRVTRSLSHLSRARSSHSVSTKSSHTCRALASTPPPKASTPNRMRPTDSGAERLGDSSAEKRLQMWRKTLKQGVLSMLAAIDVRSDAEEGTDGMED